MTTLGETLSKARKERKISIEKASQDLLIKKEQLLALENANWGILPEPPFVKGFIKTYASYLKLDSDFVLALYRREFDESKHVTKKHLQKPKTFFLTPSRIVTLGFLLVVMAFGFYILLQYLSILTSPKLEIVSPPNDFTTSVPIVKIEGATESQSTVSINGEFAPVDQNGKFIYQFQLEEGRNLIEIIASKRLSPKSKVTRTIRLIK